MSKIYFLDENMDCEPIYFKVRFGVFFRNIFVTQVRWYSNS